MIFCWEEEGVRIEYLSEEGVEMLQELVFDFVDICDRRIADKEGGVVVVGPGMLNKKQTGTDGKDSDIPFENVLARIASSCGMFS